MTINNQDNKEIHELPEVLTLQAGMMVAVDSEPTGTKSFNLTAALEGKAESSDVSDLATTVSGKADASTVNQLSTVVEGKIDSPTTGPVAGQVLTFDGTSNTWDNPPEGVYVLNYSEVTDIRDVDIDRARNQPTFLKIDTENPLTISVPRSSGTAYTVNLQPGTLMRLEEVGATGTSGTYTGPKFLIFGSQFGEEVGGGVMQNADFRIICCISLSAFGGVTKSLTVNGNMDPGGQLFGSPSSPGTQPFPITTSFFVGKGPGNPNTNRTQNALGVEVQSAGKIRKQVLMPEDIESHDFSADTTPEQIQFMGWGATSNRAGYKNLLTAEHNYDSTNFPTQTPQVQFLKFRMTSGTPATNQVMDVVQATMKSADGQNTAVIGGLLVPALNSVGVLQNWADATGSYYGWKTVNEVPASTSINAGNVLAVDSNGTPVWGNAVGFVKNVGALTDAATITASNLNNGFATLSTSQSTLTIIDVVGTDEIVNFAVEITPSVNCTLTIKKKVGSNEAVTLKHSVAAGNTLEANKTYQVTAVGGCWTLAEFEA